MARFPIEKPVQVAVVVVSIILIILPTIFIALRIWAKRLSGRAWNWSDTFVMIGWSLSVPYTAMSIVSVTYWGVGYHFTDVIAKYGMAPVTEFLKFMVAGQVLWPMSVSSVKFSVLLFYLQLFKGTHSAWQRNASFALITIHILYTLATIILAFSICQPISKYWHPEMTTGHCGDTNKSYTASGIVDFVTDFAIVTLPIPTFLKLQALKLTKLWLLATFAGGYITSAISLARLICITKVDMTDLTYNVPATLVLGTAEPAIGIVCICIPMLQPLLRETGLRSSNKGSSNLTPGGPRTRSREWSKMGDDNNMKLGQDDSSETELRQVSNEPYKADDISHSRRNPSSSRRPKHGIKVQQEWEVTSTSNSSL